MSYSIIPTDKFKKEVKRLIKKYPSLKDELIELNLLLSKEPTSGTSIGNNTFKIRISIKSKSKGKSGGGRVITYVVNAHKEVYLLTIYDKSEYSSGEDAALKTIFNSLKD